MNRQLWWQKKRIILGAVTLSVTVLIMLMRFLGWFQGLELAVYDRFWSKKAISQWDDRVVVIGYDNDDEAKYGHEISDANITKVLQKVERGKPAVVGLSLTRRGYPPNLIDRQALVAQMEAMGHFSDPVREQLYKAKCVQEKKRCEQLLFQTTEEDTFPRGPDNILRKAQLYRDNDYAGLRINPDRNRHFIWDLAFQYLRKQGATINEPGSLYSPIVISYPQGNTVEITPLSPVKDGGYNAKYSDLNNFQILISWIKESTPELSYISFESILNSPPQDFEGKIIIIGRIAHSYQANADLPMYGQKEIYGKRHYVEITGIIVGNLLNQAETPFVQLWKDEQEYLYFFLWMLISGILVGFIGKRFKTKYDWFKFTFNILLLWIILIGITGFISFRAFPYWWVPCGFIWVGLTVNIILNRMIALAIQVTKEQQQALVLKDQLIKEQRERLEDEKRLNREKEIEIEDLKINLLAQERLAFFGKISPFVRHEIMGLYDDFYRKIDRIQKATNKQEEKLFEVLPLLEQNLLEDEVEEQTEVLLNSGRNILSRLQEMEGILDKSSDLITRFFPLVRENSTDNFINPDLIDLNELLRECTQITTYNFIYSKNKDDFDINIVEEFEPNLLPFWGVISELRFIFVNLIENAYYAVLEKEEKASEDYVSMVLLKTQYIDKSLQVIIQDNGIGIKVEFVKKIFNPLFTTKKKYKQTGVGLSLTKDLLNLNYKASIDVTFRDDLTCFIINFPLLCPLSK